MRIFEGVERQVALFTDRVVATQVGDQRVRKLMQTEGEDPAEEDNGEGQVKLFLVSVGV